MSGLTVFDLMAAARRYPCRNVGEKITLIVLVERMSQNEAGEWVAWPGEKLIAAETGQNAGTVRGHIARMESDGLLQRRRRPTHLGRGSLANEIVLNSDMLTNSGLPAVGPSDQPRDQGMTNRVIEPSAPHIEEQENNSAGASFPLGASFEQFWREYPRKIGRPAAERAWRAVVKRSAPALVDAGLQRWLTFWRISGTEQSFIPHPSTFLNQERWADMPPPARKPSRPQVDDFGQTIVVEV